MAEPVFTFRRLTAQDVPLLHEWTARPHVAEWWRSDGSVDEMREKYLPRIASDSDTRPYIASLGSTPAAYTQSYVAVESDSGWWHGQHDRGVLGIDQFLADAGSLGRGLGTALVNQFVQRLFRDPAIWKIQVDPDPANLRAIRCYEKAGFHRVETITTPDGPVLLMALERPAR